jgi:hypothetical protein
LDEELELHVVLVQLLVQPEIDLDVELRVQLL